MALGQVGHVHRLVHHGRIHLQPIHEISWTSPPKHNGIRLAGSGRVDIHLRRP